MATDSECRAWIAKIAPPICKYAKQYGIHMAGFVIAQGCYESGWGTSNLARNHNNFFGIGGPGNWYSYPSLDAGCEGYFKHTVLAKSEAGKAATTFDQYAAAYVKSGYSDASVIEALTRPIYNQYNLSQYDDSDSGSNKCEEFVQKALSYKGTSASSWSAKHPKWYHAGVWCADFVSACGEEVDILGKVFDGSASAYACAHSVENYGGTVHNEKSYTPQRGDLVNFMWNGGSATSGYADHIGIVTECKDGTVYTIEGNTSNSVAERSYSRSSSVLACFCSPDWSKVGGYSAGAIFGNLFDELCTREDAILREAAYLQATYETDSNRNKKVVKAYQASATPTDIKLSVVNYTDLFQAFWEAGVGLLNDSSSTSGSYDYSKLESKVRTVVLYLVEKGLNNAAACGIAGNIKHESSFSTDAIGDSGTSFGICQWHNERGTRMKEMAGANWSNNLTGQLDYLWYELENNYSSLLQSLKNVENTESGCRSAADMFVRQFERPANVDYQSSIRQDSAAEYFNQITQIVTSTSSSNYVSVNYANLSADRQAAVKRAYEEQGKPYAWGATGPDSYDCSGLVGYCLTGSHSRLGTTYTFAAWSHTSSPVPGDVCLSASHAGIYIGDSKMIHAPKAGDVVKIGPVQSGMWYCVYPGFK